jgi:hypothetical protein
VLIKVNNSTSVLVEKSPPRNKYIVILIHQYHHNSASGTLGILFVQLYIK